MEYITKDHIIIFAPYNNYNLDKELLNAYNKIIFSDFYLIENIIECYEQNNFISLLFKGSNFNKKVNNN